MLSRVLSQWLLLLALMLYTDLGKAINQHAGTPLVRLCFIVCEFRKVYGQLFLFVCCVDKFVYFC